MAGITRSVAQNIRRLRTANRGAAAVLLLLAAGLASLLAQLGEPLSLHGAQDLLFGGREATVSAGQSALFAGIALIAFLLVSTVIHLLVSMPRMTWYEIGIRSGYSTARWVDLALSSCLVLWVIAEITQIAQTASFLVVIAVNAAVLALGARLDKADAPGRALYPGFLIGAVVAALPWLALLVYVMGPGSTDETRPAVFVFLLVLTVFATAGAFAANQLLQRFRVGPWRNIAFGEGLYIALNLIAKVALSAQIVAAAVLPRLAA